MSGGRFYLDWVGIRDPELRAALARGAGRPPLPIVDPAEALERALQLRSRHLSYGAISEVMGLYHGVWSTASGWHSRLRNAGAAAAPRGSGQHPGGRLVDGRVQGRG